MSDSVTVEIKQFEERSDYIDDRDLIMWNVKNDYFDNIQKELLGTGTRLLVGPRGTGKTHQMKITYQNCITDETKPIAIFVSLNKYFYLEPLLTQAPNAIKIFHAWILSKILLGCYAYLTDRNIDIQDFFNSEDGIFISFDLLNNFQRKAESPYSTQLDSDEVIDKLSIGRVINIIENVMLIANKQRAIILLDDAALTLTPEYFVEFLDIFRSLKTKNIAPKASVYPGTTQYSPRFHVGHDAQFVYCWMSVENERYSEFMDSLIDIRFAELKNEINKEALEILKYASFGVPRTFIGLIRGFLSANAIETTLQSKFNVIIDQRASLIEAEYLSLRKKMPQYSNVLDVGWDFFNKIIYELKEENKNLVNEKNIVVGILEEDNKMMLRMIGFLREAGLIYEEESTVKHGGQREYKRYIPHLLFLVQNRTFSKGRGFSTSEILNQIKAKAKKHPLRRTFNTVLSSDNIKNLKLNLPPCQVCKTPRLTEEQKFCHNCGNQLVNQSTFEQCLNMQIDDLPLTVWQKDNIKGIKIKTIGDFLALSNPGGELRKIKGIGKIRSEKITLKIQDTVKEFLDRTLTDFLS
jgi:hypothetical protein